LYHKNKIIWSKVEIATLKMHKLTTKEIKNYIKHEKPLNSCGSYKLESLGFHLFSKIDGSDNAIQGLPLIPLLRELKKHGIYSIEKISSI
jgi:septum formation protein